jgi:hypothetical protein
MASGLRSLAALRDDFSGKGNKAARHTSKYQQWSAAPLLLLYTGVILSVAKDLFAIFFNISYLYEHAPPAWPAK